MFLTVLGQPVPKGRPRFNRKTGAVYTPAATANHESLIQKTFLESKGHQLAGGPLRMRITFDMKIPKSWNKARKAEAETGYLRPTTGADCDNLAKCVADALNILAYEDDSQIVEMILVKKYSTEPKTIINIERVE
jgi:Holliday junction resolvase RusA-like endonuclease|tara:strand:- start:1099 stop:1503 length:405 start_codon:yes stop_codon:yes gene_type:complete